MIDASVSSILGNARLGILVVSLPLPVVRPVGIHVKMIEHDLATIPKLSTRRHGTSLPTSMLALDAHLT